MGATPRFIFYLLAVICFALAAFTATPRNRAAPWWPLLIALGLGLAVFPLMWDALALT